jgi:dinuclear metal center YbgI/SA1388 family protein
MKLKEIISTLEQLAPLSYQESYDNSGLITGDPEMEIKGILVCLDSTEAILEEAKANGCNLIVAHHPIVFSGLKKITGKNYVERVIIKSIREEIAIYAIHTNLDNVKSGVNAGICDRLGLVKTQILLPLVDKLRKLVTYAPLKDAERVREALFEAGAGKIGNYDLCSFNLSGTGTFRPNEGANPHVGEKNLMHEEAEIRIEVLFESHLEDEILDSLRKSHKYEEIAYYIYALENKNQYIGAGMTGELKEPMDADLFLNHLKKVMKTSSVRYTAPLTEKVKKVAVCGGSGSFLLQQAIRSGAQVFVSADFKYHQFFDAEGKIMIADIGHFESEQFTIDLLGAYLREKFPKFAVRLTELNTNPINYL